MQAHDVTRRFESALCGYTGARYAVTTNSCTNALLLALRWFLKDVRGVQLIEVPRHTYVSVPMSVIHAGGKPVFTDRAWRGSYQLKPFPVWDCAREFRRGMYPDNGQFLCVSFHASKILGDSQGGAILHADEHADRWLRRARFDGRTEGVHPKEDNPILGWHCYLSPDVAARLLWKLPAIGDGGVLANDDYPDLSLMEAFK